MLSIYNLNSIEQPYHMHTVNIHYFYKQKKLSKTINL